MLISCSKEEKKSEIITERELIPYPEKYAKDKIAIDSIQQDSILKEYSESQKLDNYLIHSIPDSNFVVIEKSCGIFIYLDSIEIEKRKKKYGEEDFNTSADDDMFYISNAQQFLEKNRIKSISPEERYLKFIINKKPIFFDTKSPANLGGVYLLFKPDTLPRFINPIDIEIEFEKYFKKKIK